MSLVGVGEAYQPVHARPKERRASRSWTPLVVILLLYAVLLGLNEWRLRSHIDNGSPTVVSTEVDVPSSGPGFSGVDR